MAEDITRQLLTVPISVSMPPLPNLKRSRELRRIFDRATALAERLLGRHVPIALPSAARSTIQR